MANPAVSEFVGVVDEENNVCHVRSPRDGDGAEALLSLGNVSGARLVRDSAEMTTGEVELVRVAA